MDEEQEMMEKMMKLQLGVTTLDNQITFMDSLNSGMPSPLTEAILASLKELKGIKKANIPKDA
jgi:hypothetical protein